MKSKYVNMLWEKFKDPKIIKKLLKHEIPEECLNKIDECFGEMVFWNHNDSCRVGKLIGLIKDHKTPSYDYLIIYHEKEIRVPIWKSLTKI